MSIWKFISGVFQPIADIVDELHTSDEERMQIKTKLVELQNQVTNKVLDYETQLLNSQAKVITAEAQGQSWLQRSWRPITMLTFLVLVVLDTMGMTEFRLSDQAWDLLQIGIGGYVVGRSVEKAAPHISQSVKNFKDKQ